MTAACPRCGLAEVTEPVCPRCGVVVAKALALDKLPRVARAPVDVATEAESGGFSWPLAIAAAVLLLASAIAAKSWLRTPAQAPPLAIVTAPAVVVATAPPDLPSLSTTPPPTLPALAAMPADTSVREDDVRRANALTQRLNQRAAFARADVDVAEELHSRYPGERPLELLLEGVLVESARQDVKRRDLGGASALLKRATAVRPGSETPWLDLIEVMKDSADWIGMESAARGLLALNARSASGWRSLGYALVRQDRNREAIEALDQSLSLEEHAETRALLARLRKGSQDEKGMTEQRLAHFNVRYDGEEHEAVGREILSALERHYATLSATLDHQPSVSVPVILFSREGYFNASGAPAWSGGVYDGLDGRIRIPIGGLTASLTPEMDGTLIHELTHAFVADRTRGLAPREIQEGLAQFMEGKRTDTQLSKEQMVWLADGRIGGVAGFYLYALSFVEYLMATRSQGGMNDLLKAMGESGSIDGAFSDVYGQDMHATKVKWAQRLRQQYGS